VKVDSLVPAAPRVAVLGYGYWGPNQVRAFCDLLGEDKVVVCDPDPARLALARARHPGAAFVADLADLPATQRLDAVSLCTPAGLHAKQAAGFLAQDCHVLVEKPLATSSRDARAMVALAAARGRVLMVGHVFLFHPAVRALRRLIQSGELGDIRFVTSLRASLGPRVRSEVNVVWDYLIHDAYIVPYLLDAAPISVRAEGGSWLQPGVADAAFATLAFDGGVLASLQSSWYFPVKARRMVIVGSRRMAVWDEDAEQKLTLHDRGYAQHEGVDQLGNRGLRLYDQGVQAVPLDNTEPLKEECRSFLQRVAGRHDGVASGASAVRTLKVLEAIDRSMRQRGSRVLLRSPERSDSGDAD
jgi:predicted dehydrogenase